MDDYRKYLAQQILTEDKLVTYRLVSRALKVHVNTAKEMLYDFHKWQNDKKPNRLHATYLVYGTRKVDGQDGDVEMTDSMSEPEMALSDEVAVHTLALIKEEELQDALQQYDEVTSIHIYSLAPHPLKDFQLLADTAQQVMKITLADDSPSSNKIYGTFTNPNVRKRERRGPKPNLTPAAAKSQPEPQVKQDSKPAVKEEPKVAQPADPKERIAVATAKKSTAAPSLKRQGSSGGIGQMFAKAAAKPKKPPPKPREEEPSPTFSDDGEDEGDAMPEPKKETEAAASARRNRQTELRRMMEESDDDEPAAKADSDADEPMEEPEPEPEPEQKPKVEEGPVEVVSSTGGGRRRGRRRVTKKKQIMDDKGYLVTIQEQAWESFSEDEAPSPPPKPKVEKAPAEKPAGKGKKGAAKGQGNIMSFFSKK